MPLEPLLAELEQNMSDELSVERLAGAGTRSRSQLYRDFYSVTGHTVSDYIRRRRLSNALALIKTSRLPLADIAYQCGFSSQQALSRSVRQALGMTPLAYKNSEAWYFFPPAHTQGSYAGRALFPVSVKPERIPPTLRLQYYDSRLKGIEDRALAWLLASRPGYQGRVFGRNGAQKGPKLCYELYIESDMADQPAMGSLFATTTVPNDGARINAAWDYLYLTWLAGSMFERAGQPYFEEYILKKGRCAKLRLYLPIQKRAGCANLTLETDPALHFVIATAKTEKAASRAVTAFLTARYPHVMQGASQFYLQQNEKGYTCGIAADTTVEEHALTPEPGHYLVLHSPATGEYDALCGRLLAFAGDNGMAARREDCFAVYDARGGYGNLEMKVYCQVNFLQKNENLERSDKTTPAGCDIIGLSNR